jgi:uncharacterized membrane protein YgdD (TMEM256/DUF423 family)
VDTYFLELAAIFGALAVALGAFGSHALRARLSADLLRTFETGVAYQMYHALALIGVGLLVQRFGSGLLSVAGWLFVVGILLFSGSLYMLAATRIRLFGMVTPFGGIAFILGWLTLFLVPWSRG